MSSTQIWIRFGFVLSLSNELPLWSSWKCCDFNIEWHFEHTDISSLDGADPSWSVYDTTAAVDDIRCIHEIVHPYWFRFKSNSMCFTLKLSEAGHSCNRSICAFKWIRGIPTTWIVRRCNSTVLALFTKDWVYEYCNTAEIVFLPWCDYWIDQYGYTVLIVIEWLFQSQVY